MSQELLAALRTYVLERGHGEGCHDFNQRRLSAYGRNHVFRCVCGRQELVAVLEGALIVQEQSVG